MSHFVSNDLSLSFSFALSLSLALTRPEYWQINRKIWKRKGKQRQRQRRRHEKRKKQRDVPLKLLKKSGGLQVWPRLQNRNVFEFWLKQLAANEKKKRRRD